MGFFQDFFCFIFFCTHKSDDVKFIMRHCLVFIIPKKKNRSKQWGNPNIKEASSRRNNKQNLINLRNLNFVVNYFIFRQAFFALKNDLYFIKKRINYYFTLACARLFFFCIKRCVCYIEHLYRRNCCIGTSFFYFMIVKYYTYDD